jgi:cold shock CspA family protein
MFGTVVVSVHARGFCFIAPDGATSREDHHFAHRSSLIEFAEVPPKGTCVEFDSSRNDRGLLAKNVRPVTDGDR